MYVVFSLLNSKVDTEVKSVLGRADVVIKTKNDIYVLKLKVDESVDNALAQIDSKGYAIPYEADGRTITKCVVAISQRLEISRIGVQWIMKARSSTNRSSDPVFHYRRKIIHHPNACNLQ